MTETKGLIYEKIPAIMAEISSISKDRKNTMQNYQFRGIDDIYNYLHPILAKHGVFTVPVVRDERTEERKTKSGGVLIYRVLTIDYHIYASDGSFVVATVIGEGMDSGDKAANKAMSVGQKYTLLQIFAIPTEDDKDPENDSPEVVPKKQANTPTPNNTTPSIKPATIETTGNPFTDLIAIINNSEGIDKPSWMSRVRASNTSPVALKEIYKELTNTTYPEATLEPELDLKE